jgi:hypothetical protein
MQVCVRKNLHKEFKSIKIAEETLEKIAIMFWRIMSKVPIFGARMCVFFSQRPVTIKLLNAAVQTF